MRPLFSCVMPVKGERPFMKDALASLEAQGLGSDLEIIIQDGDVEPDKGQSDALNKGFAKANGEWLFWLNADDVLLPGALQKVKAVIHSTTTTPRIAPAAQLASLGGYSNYSSLSWITGDMLRIDSKGRCVEASVGNRWHDWLFRHAVPHVHGPSSFFCRELWERVGGCDVSLRYCMDWDLWIRFMQAGARFVRVNDFLWSLRQWEGSKTQGHADAQELSRQEAEVKRMLGKNNFKITRGAVWKYRLWRMLCGCYLKAWLEVRRRK